VNLEGSVANFGRNASGLFLMDLCAPHALLRMRNSNTLQGHFFADQVRSDFNNVGICCARGECGCFDEVSPTTLPTTGGTITLSGGCDLENITAVTVCGLPCPITYQDPSRIECTAPPGTGTCQIEGESGTGTFISSTMINYFIP
jgi:hypothetical protein